MTTNFVAICSIAFLGVHQAGVLQPVKTAVAITPRASSSDRVLLPLRTDAGATLAQQSVAAGGVKVSGT
jgi:hypothetical protein